MLLTRTELEARIEELEEEKKELHDRLDQIARLSVPEEEEHEYGGGGDYEPVGNYEPVGDYEPVDPPEEMGGD